MSTVIALVPLGIEDNRNSGALARVRGATLLTHTVLGIVRSGCVDRVVVAGPQATRAEYADAVAAAGDRRIVLVPGGGDRIESARKALLAAAPAAHDIVLVHEPARPFTPEANIRAVVDAVRSGAPAVVPVEPVTDTVKVVDSRGEVLRTSDRENLRRAQSPRGFTAAFLRTVDLADALSLAGVRARAVPGHPNGLRVHTPFERTVAEALLEERE
ncbi:2-C-methyl-D-erythritol 4-phosphate cytidylyltransferase [Saccharomonospora xinjiangensis]|uniref:IspD/TarI family cytidylyltransferase n=1 Tax=Saccharomonospora xinjiangensis TaxID=75294 RepID=UPI00350ECE73